MKLHEFKTEFEQLIPLVSQEKHLPESAVERDYYIVLMLQNLEQSEYADQCVFKGGTSLSKCYPGSIERFSEDIDLTFLGGDITDKQYDKKLKAIEQIMTAGFETEKIIAERNNRNKSILVWQDSKENSIKLEIGSSIRPDPYSKKRVKTYIQEYLEARGMHSDVESFELKTVLINTLNIERTFVDKVMSVKRHAICGTLNKKVRHIYDVVRLYSMPEIQAFLANKNELKRLLKLTKQTDSFYLGKRNISVEYNPLGSYAFNVWRHAFNDTVKSQYEQLHETLLYTDKKQEFSLAIGIFEKINAIFAEINE